MPGMTAIHALECVQSFCHLHKRWLQRAMSDSFESDELKETMRPIRLGSLDELNSIIGFVDEMIANLKKEETNHDD